MRPLTLFLVVTMAVSTAHAKSRVLCPGCDANLSWMDDPMWWMQNPTARNTQLQVCRERRPGTEPLMRYCLPAARAAQMTGAR